MSALDPIHWSAEEPVPVMNQDFKNALWATANKLRGSVDPSDYKYPVLGLIFLKYVSDAFYVRQAEILAGNLEKDLFIVDVELRQEALTIRDSYTMKNVLYVPEKARWPFLQGSAKQPLIALLLDQAMELLEDENPKLAGLLPKVYVKTTLEGNAYLAPQHGATKIRTPRTMVIRSTSRPCQQPAST